MTQNRPLQEMKFRASWTWPWGPQFVVSGSISQHNETSSKIVVLNLGRHCFTFDTL